MGRAISTEAGLNPFIACTLFAGLMLSKKEIVAYTVISTLGSTLFLPIGVWVIPQIVLFTMMGLAYSKFVDKVNKENIFKTTVLGITGGLLYGITIDTIMWFIDPWYQLAYANPVQAVIGGIPYDLRSTFNSSIFVILGSTAFYVYSLVSAKVAELKTSKAMNNKLVMEK